MHDWDDLRVFLAAARSGSLSLAAQRLGIDPATAGRRLSRLETSLKATLFVRAPSGLSLTSSGQRTLEGALDVEAAIEKVARASASDSTIGTVRISASEGFGAAIVAPAIVHLRRQKPGLRIQLAAQAKFLSTSKREVDIAVTLSAPSSTRVVVEPLTDYELGLYASTDYLRTAPSPETLAELIDHPIVGYIEDLLYAPELRYLEEISPNLRPDIASSSIQAQRAVIHSGGGIGILPCFLARGLVRLLPSQILIKRRFWLSTHRDAAETARVRFVQSWLRQLAQKSRPILMPSR